MSGLFDKAPGGGAAVQAASLAHVDTGIDVSIVIVSWNTEQLLHVCLASIVQSVTATNYEIIVVDNGSSDASVEMVAREFPDVRLLVNPRNTGFAAANNRGVYQALGRYFLLLNSDTVVLPGALEAMVRYMDAHPRVGALGPRLLLQDQSIQISAHDFPRLDHDAVVLLEVKHWPLIGDLARRYAQRSFEPQHQETREVDWVIGACLLLRREAVAQAGSLDEGYFFFFEEPDLCYRLRKRGWSTVYLSGAEIIHYGGQSRARIPAVSELWYYRGLLRFYRLHATQVRYLAVRVGVIVGMVGHVVWSLGRLRSSDGQQRFTAYVRILACALKGV